MLQRFGKIVVHLCLDALLAIAKHSMSSESDDGGPSPSNASFVFTYLCGGLQPALKLHSGQNLNIEYLARLTIIGI